MVVRKQNVIPFPVGVHDALPRQDRAGVGLERNDRPSQHVKHRPRPEVRDPNAERTAVPIPNAQPHRSDGLGCVAAGNRRVLRGRRHDDVVVPVPNERVDGAFEPRRLGFDRQRDDDHQR